MAARSIVVRKAALVDAPGIAHVHVEAWRETYAPLVDEEFANSFGERDRLAQWMRAFSDASPSDIFVADAGGEVVGFASAGPIAHKVANYAGELFTIYVLRAFHGNGVGRRLVRAAAARMLERLMHSMVAIVLPQNQAARRFYERLGATPLENILVVEEGRELTHVIYGWPDLRALAAQTTKRPE